MAHKELHLRDDEETSFTGEDLPEQRGSAAPTVMPGISVLQLPANLDQCWQSFDIEKKDAQGNTITYQVDTPGYDAEGQPTIHKAGEPMIEQHLMLNMNRENPMLVITSSNSDNVGLPATATMSTLGRKRGKRDDPEAPIVADLTYLLRIALADKTPIAKRRDWIPAVSKHAGKTVRLEHGLSAYCDPERVRYLDDGDGGSVEDPDGTHGCGNSNGKKDKSRLYSQDFKTQIVDPTDPNGTKMITVFTERALCKSCNSLLRGFFRVERFLPPL